MVASPNPVVVQNCTVNTCSRIFAYRGTTTLRVSESGGVGGQLNLVSVTLPSSLNGEDMGTFTYEAVDITSLAGTTRVNAMSVLDVPDVTMLYRFTAGGRVGTATYRVRFTDDKGNVQELSITVPFV